MRDNNKKDKNRKHEKKCCGNCALSERNEEWNDVIFICHEKNGARIKINGRPCKEYKDDRPKWMHKAKRRINYDRYRK